MDDGREYFPPLAYGASPPTTNNVVQVRSTAVDVDVANGEYHHLTLAVHATGGAASFRVELHYADGSSSNRDTIVPDWLDDPSRGPRGDATLGYMANGLDVVDPGFGLSGDP